MATETIKTFNSLVESFLAQTSELVGTTYYTLYKKLIKVNALVPIEAAIKIILPHKNQIFAKDEAYLNDETNYIQDINNAADDTPQDKILNEIFKLKNIYNKLDDESKENVWSILQALVQLCIEYCEIKGIKYN
jgi:hypothetical protein